MGKIGSLNMGGGSTSVVNLVPDDFQSVVVNDIRHWAVALYADWCPHCQFFAPKWEELATKYSKEKGLLMFGALNCAQYNTFCNRLGVEAYPTLRVWHFPNISASEGSDGYQIPVEPIKAAVDKWFVAHESDLAPTTANVPPPVNGETAPPPMSTSIDQSPLDVAAQLRLHDAEITILFAFRQGVFLQSRRTNVNGVTSSVLRKDTLADLLAFLDFASAKFPSKQAGQDLAELATIVRRLVARQGEVEHVEWNKALDTFHLDGFPPEAGIQPQNFWKSCRTYTCGLWSLFHIISLVSQSDTPTPSAFELVPSNALSMIRTFVVRFFGCKSCVRHFIAMYDACTFGRCPQQADAEGAALWLWNAHNNVTMRVADERHLPRPAPWPSPTLCPACWMNGEPVNASIYKYLNDSYWPQQSMLSKPLRGQELPWLAVIVVAIGVVACCVTSLACLLNQDESKSFVEQEDASDVE